MTQNKKRVQAAPIDTFATAFIKLMKCTREEMDIKMITKNQQAFVLYKERGYQIATREALSDEIEDQLTHNDAAQHINIYIWIQVTKYTVSISRFLPTLVRKLKNEEQAQLLYLALGINSFSKDKYECFWITLANIDNEGTLLGNAIVSAREIYDGDDLLNNMTETMIENGLDEYNMIVGGIFESVYLKQKNGAGNTFYIYSAERTFNDGTN
ncbi:MAG: hypothetical protein JWP37_3479 [Mucilaginibacter sp.]|nr:hypothetical protein [Mucilaginibacter sp.]